MKRFSSRVVQEPPEVTIEYASRLLDLEVVGRLEGVLQAPGAAATSVGLQSQSHRNAVSSMRPSKP